VERGRRAGATWSRLTQNCNPAPNAQNAEAESAGTHRVRGSPFSRLRAFFVWTAVHVRPYISNRSPDVSWRSTAVSWTRPFGYRSAMRVSTGSASVDTLRYRFISAGFSPRKNVRLFDVLVDLVVRRRHVDRSAAHFGRMDAQRLVNDRKLRVVKRGPAGPRPSRARARACGYARVRRAWCRWRLHRQAQVGSFTRSVTGENPYRCLS